MLSNLKVVAFDLDNTIYNELNLFRSVLKIGSNKIGYSLADINKFDDIYNFRKPDLFKSFLISVKKYTEYNKNILFDIYKSNMEIEPLSSKKKNFFKKLKMKLSTCILTNGIVEIQKNKVEALQLNDYFDKIFYAREDGIKFEKPCHHAFYKITKFFNCNSNEVLFVGDSIDKDINGASAVGMKTVLNYEFLNKPDIKNNKSEYTIQNILELNDLLID